MIGTNVLRRACQGIVIPLMLLTTASANAATVLFQENFDGITSGYYNAPSGCCGATHSISGGVPTAGGGNSINGGADRDWYGARFEYSSSGDLIPLAGSGNGSFGDPGDIGVQEFGGLGNDSPVGLVSDDGGLLFKVNTTGFENISISFDWRTFKSASSDKLVFGYFVGDLTDGHPDGGFAADRTIDLQNEYHFTNGGSVSGPHDGPWNWDPVNGPGNQGDWVELLRVRDNNVWHSETFDSLNGLVGVDGQSEVWFAWWLDNGDKDFGKFDNVVVMGDAVAVVPVPPAVWLFGSGILGLVAVSRRRKQ